jgi:hypothetical protein
VRHEPGGVDADPGEDGVHLLVAEVFDPEGGPRGAELRVGAFPGVRGTSRVGDERGGDDVDFLPVLLASLSDGVAHLFHGGLAGPRRVWVDGLRHRAPERGSRRILGLESTAGLAV